jgi:N utilization substance protein B
MNNRRLAREYVLKSLYAHQQSGDTVQHVTDTILKEAVKADKEIKRFAEQLFFKTLENRSQFNEIISRHIKNWEIERLALIDKLVLQMALCEFLYFEDIPTKVTINEAIELVKKFSTAKSGRFVNGILDASLYDLKSDDKIKKTGRGLIEKSHK